MQAILLLLVLIAPASATYADSRYVEVWNPPEARLVHPSKSSHKPATSHKHAAKQPPTHIAKVAEPALGGTAAASVTPPPAPGSAAPAGMNRIPRIIGPDGNPMRVTCKVRA